MNIKDLLKRIGGTREVSGPVPDDFPKSKPITDAAIDDKSDIIFSVRKHNDGKYSVEIKQIPSEDIKLDKYAKWLAGSFARAIQRFDEIFNIEDKQNIAEKISFSEVNE